MTHTLRSSSQRGTPRETGGWHNSFVGKNDRIDQYYQGQMISTVSSVPMGGIAYVDCGLLVDRPQAVHTQAVHTQEWLALALRDECDPLRNDLYNIWPQPDGSLHIANRQGSGFDVFRPEFTAIRSNDKPTTSQLKWAHPIYNLPAWKLADGTVQADVSETGDVISLVNPAITRNKDTIVWTVDIDNQTVIFRSILNRIFSSATSGRPQQTAPKTRVHEYQGSE